MLTIARALASKPDLIMLDEPSEGLSPMMVQTIRDGILESRARACPYSLSNKTSCWLWRLPRCSSSSVGVPSCTRLAVIKFCRTLTLLPSIWE